MSPRTAPGVGGCGACGRVRRRAHGFTLIEVLLATVLMAAGLTLAFATITAATQTTRRGEAIAERSERMRAVEAFLRSRLSAARPVAFGFDQASALPLRFIGSRDRMQFVADLPDYLGRGGPYRHDFQIEDDGRDRRIVLGLSVVQASQTFEERQPLPPEPLVGELRSAGFRYRALDAEGRLGEWTDEWKQSEQLPLLVEVTLTDRDGTAWPRLVVRLPQAGMHGFGGVQ